VKPYCLIDHTADLGLEVFGKTGEELFANAASAVCELMLDIENPEPTAVREISVEGTDREDLLVNFLREVLFLFNGEKMVPTSFIIEELDDRHLRGKVRVAAYDPARHRVKREVKAVTYHGTEVVETPTGWRARVIFDV